MPGDTLDQSLFVHIQEQGVLVKKIWMHGSWTMIGS